MGTLAVSSCIVVAVRNPDLQRGYLGHFSSPHSQFMGNRAEFDEMVERIKAAEAASPQLEAWISGGTNLSGDEASEDHAVHNEEVRADQEYVLGRIITEVADEGSVDIDWLGNNEVLTVVTFDPAAAVNIQYLREPIAEDHDQWLKPSP